MPALAVVSFLKTMFREHFLSARRRAGRWVLGMLPIWKFCALVEGGVIKYQSKLNCLSKECGLIWQNVPKLLRGWRALGRLLELKHDTPGAEELFVGLFHFFRFKNGDQMRVHKVDFPCPYEVHDSGGITSSAIISSSHLQEPFSGRTQTASPCPRTVTAHPSPLGPWQPLIHFLSMILSAESNQIR